MTRAALETSSSPALQEVDPEAQTRELFVQLSLEFQTQFHCIGHEVDRTKALLEDAIATLMTSFTSIHEALGSLPAQSISNESGVESLNAMRNVLAEDLNAAVRSLQFQDMTDQLLGHVNRRLADMTDVLNEIVIASVTRSDFGDFLRASREAVMRHEVAAEERGVGPVSQGHCEAGDIDLF